MKPPTTAHAKKKSFAKKWVKPVLIAIVSGVVVAASQYLLTQKQYFEQSIWAQKRDTYTRALKVVNRMMRSSPNNAGKKIDFSISPTAEDVNDCYVELATYSNRDILRAYIKCIGPGPKSINGSRIELIDAMRKDLGIDTEKLDDTDLYFDFGLDPVEIQKANNAGFH